MSDTPIEDEREHATDPAEGADAADPATGTPDPREHPEEPAEGDV